MTAGPVLVGIDGSDSALAAARWAAGEALLRRASMRLVYAFGWLPVRDADDSVQLVPGRRDNLRNVAEERLDIAATQVAAVAPDLAVSREVLTGYPARLLAELSAHAQLVVVGNRGLGGFGGLLLGSVGAALAAHAACPVVVVRGRSSIKSAHAGPVVVGVDGSPLSDAALTFAVQAAVARRAPLRAVHTWLDAALPVVNRGVDWDVVSVQEEDVLSQRLAGWRETYPDLQIESVVVQDRPAHTLLEQASDAQLLVVGSRGRGGLTGMALGSVSQAVLCHAQCPVAVVR